MFRQPARYSEDDYLTGCRNVSHYQQQQSYSTLRSPRRSNSTYFWNDSWVQTFHSSLYFHELNKKLVVIIPQLISEHQEEFIAMLNSPNEPGDAAPQVGAPSAQGRPGQERPEMVLNVTAQEKEAIERVGECVIFVITVLEKSTVQ